MNEREEHKENMKEDIKEEKKEEKEEIKKEEIKETLEKNKIVEEEKKEKTEDKIEEKDLREQDLLVPNEEYLKAGIHIGTKFKTSYMKKFIYKTRPDGLTVLDIQKIDERIKIAINMLSQYDPKDILLISRRENGWKPIKLMAKLLGTKVFAGRYPPGVMTNPSLKNFVEAKIMLVTDAWPDRNAITDALKIGTPVIALCDTNNQTNNIDFVVPCNNKGKKSLGLVFWALTKGIMEKKGLINKGQAFDYSVDDFTEE